MKAKTVQMGTIGTAARFTGPGDDALTPGVGAYDLAQFKSLAKASETQFTFQRLNQTELSGEGAESARLIKSFSNAANSARQSPAPIRRKAAEAVSFTSRSNSRGSASPSAHFRRLGGPS